MRGNAYTWSMREPRATLSEREAFRDAIAHTLVLPSSMMDRATTRDDEFQTVPVDAIHADASTAPAVTHVLDARRSNRYRAPAATSSGGGGEGERLHRSEKIAPTVTF